MGERGENQGWHQGEHWEEGGGDGTKRNEECAMTSKTVENAG